MHIMRILKILIYLFVGMNFLLLGFLMSNPAGRVIYDIEKANITKVIDGDTINTDAGKVRLLGINAPEKNMHGYEQAKDFISLFESKEVDLVKFNQDKDQYGRKLRYAFYEGKNINELLLKLGLAHLYYYQEDDFTNKLKEAENEAQYQEIGIWTRSKDRCSKCIVLQELNELDPGEYAILKNICFHSCDLQDWTIKDDATHTEKLDFSIAPLEKKQINYKGRIWNDAGDTLYLRDNKGKLVLFYRY